jgi:hypothetical protein
MTLLLAAEITTSQLDSYALSYIDNIFYQDWMRPVARPKQLTCLAITGPVETQENCAV